jgi:phosphoribosylanthranilate isomerase
MGLDQNGMTLVKICGITNLEDARAAIAAGADMLGFNFYRPSARFVEPAEVRKIVASLAPEILNQSIGTIGVFVNEGSPAAVMRIVEESGVSGVQLHGDESIEFCRDLKLLLKDRLLIKVLRVSDTFAPSDVQLYQADAIMLDAFHDELRGGTGKIVDWDIGRLASSLVPRLFLAGGLSPENVTQAIDRAQAYAVDACSSLESSPGQKDAQRMKAFVQAVRNG